MLKLLRYLPISKDLVAIDNAVDGLEGSIFLSDSGSSGLPGPPSGHEGPGNGRLKASFLSPSSRQENAVGCQVEDLRYAEEAVFGIFYLLNHIDGFPGLKGPSAAKVVEEDFLVNHFVSNLDDLLIFN